MRQNNKIIRVIFCCYYR